MILILKNVEMKMKFIYKILSIFSYVASSVNAQINEPSTVNFFDFNKNQTSILNHEWNFEQFDFSYIYLSKILYDCPVWKTTATPVYLAVKKDLSKIVFQGHFIPKSHLSTDYQLSILWNMVHDEFRDACAKFKGIQLENQTIYFENFNVEGDRSYYASGICSNNELGAGFWILQHWGNSKSGYEAVLMISFKDDHFENFFKD